MWMRVSASTTRVFVAFSIVNLVFPLYERRAARVSRGIAAEAASAYAPQQATGSGATGCGRRAAPGAKSAPQTQARRRPRRQPLASPSMPARARHARPARGPPAAPCPPGARCTATSALRAASAPSHPRPSATHAGGRAPCCSAPLKEAPAHGPRPRRRRAHALKRRTCAQPPQAGHGIVPLQSGCPATSRAQDRAGLQTECRAPQHVADTSGARPLESAGRQITTPTRRPALRRACWRNGDAATQAPEAWRRARLGGARARALTSLISKHSMYRSSSRSSATASATSKPAARPHA